MWKSEKYKRYWCQCLIVKCLRRIVSGLIMSKNKVMNVVTSAVFDLHHSASYFLYTLKVHKKTLSKGKDDGGRPRCVLCIRKLWRARPGAPLRCPVNSWAFQRRYESSDQGRKTGGGKGLIYRTWSGLSPDAAQVCQIGKENRKKTVHRSKRRKHKIKLY